MSAKYLLKKIGDYLNKLDTNLAGEKPATPLVLFVDGNPARLIFNREPRAQFLPYCELVEPTATEPNKTYHLNETTLATSYEIALQIFTQWLEHACTKLCEDPTYFTETIGLYCIQPLASFLFQSQELDPTLTLEAAQAKLSTELQQPSANLQAALKAFLVTVHQLFVRLVDLADQDPLKIGMISNVLRNFSLNLITHANRYWPIVPETAQARQLGLDILMVLTFSKTFRSAEAKKESYRFEKLATLALQITESIEANALIPAELAAVTLFSANKELRLALNTPTKNIACALEKLNKIMPQLVQAQKSVIRDLSSIATVTFAGQADAAALNRRWIIQREQLIVECINLITCGVPLLSDTTVRVSCSQSFLLPTGGMPTHSEHQRPAFAPSDSDASIVFALLNNKERWSAQLAWGIFYRWLMLLFFYIANTAQITSLFKENQQQLAINQLLTLLQTNSYQPTLEDRTVPLGRLGVRTNLFLLVLLLGDPSFIHKVWYLFQEQGWLADAIQDRCTFSHNEAELLAFAKQSDNPKQWIAKDFAKQAPWSMADLLTYKMCGDPKAHLTAENELPVFESITNMTWVVVNTYFSSSLFFFSLAANSSRVSAA